MADSGQFKKVRCNLSALYLNPYINALNILDNYKHNSIVEYIFLNKISLNI
jgi:hypothetical protein